MQASEPTWALRQWEAEIHVLVVQTIGRTLSGSRPPLSLPRCADHIPVALPNMKRALVFLIVLVASLALGLAIANRFAELEADSQGKSMLRPPAPVAVGLIERGSITRRRTFSGALSASAEFVVAPKIPGRISRLLVNLGDPVRRGQVVARLDQEELEQNVQETEADLGVAQARLASAKSALAIAERALQRANGLRSEGVVSKAEVDAAGADQITANADVDLAQAGIRRAQAAREGARIRLGYTTIAAEWNEGDEWRVVAERRADEGATVSANTPLLSIVEIDPILAVIYAPERDYANLSVKQTAVLTTDAYPGRSFEASIARIAPIFRRSTRQARVELLVPNKEQLLKPGMFVRATIELGRVEEATILPYDALTKRAEQVGVFLLDESGDRVHWQPVQTGIREGARIEVLDPTLRGKVVVLGQELCDDGALVTVPEDSSPSRRPVETNSAQAR